MLLARVLQEERLTKLESNLIKKFEGLHLEAYLDPVNIWTIGYGHIQSAKQGMIISLEGAENLLRQDLVRYEDAVTKAVKIEINENQFAALTSLTKWLDC